MPSFPASQHLPLVLLSLAYLLTSTAALVDSSAPWHPLQQTTSFTNFYQRHLELGDFDSINGLIQDIAVTLPDTVLTQSLLGITLTLDLKELKCFGFNVGDIEVNYISSVTTSADFDLKVIQLDTTCTFNYNYDYSFLSGSGQGTAYTNDNSVVASLVFTQPNSDEPPNALAVENCQIDLQITDLDFAGGIVASILDTADRLIRGYIEGEVQRYACDKVNNLDQSATTLLGTIQSVLEKYLIDVDQTDPLQAENDFNTTYSSSLVNFQDPKGGISTIVGALLSEASKFLAMTSTDTTTGETTLGVNELIRTYLLDDSGTFALNASDVSLPENGVLLQSDGNITSTLIAVLGMRVKGLDSFTRIDPLEDIGRYTLATSFSWQELALEVDMMVELSADNQDGGITSNVTETVSIGVTFDQMEVSAALLLAIYHEALGSLQLGSLLNMKNILPCIFSTLAGANISQLDVSVGSIGMPTIVGFNSPGMDRIFATLVEGLWGMYDQVIAKALPAFFSTTIRELLTSTIQKYVDSPEGCPSPVVPPNFDFVDFRELFLNESEAISFGANGSSPFGDLGVLIRKLIDTEVIAPDSKTGLPKINKAVVDPLTEDQSNKTGTLLLPRDLLNVNSAFSIEKYDARIRFTVSEVKVENLNTMRAPLRLLDPVSDEANTLDNQITFSNDSLPLSVGARVMLEIIGDGDLNMYNEFTVRVDLTGASIALSALLKLASKTFLQFPLRDMFNLNCWTAAIQAPELTSQGLRVDRSAITAALLGLNVDLEKLALDIECVNCSSPLLYNLSSSFSAPGAEEEATRSANHVLDYFITLVEGEYFQSKIDQLLNDAPRKCPHNSAFMSDPVSYSYEPLTASLPNDSTAFVLTLALTTFGIIIAFVLERYIVKCIVYRRNMKWLRSLPNVKIYRIYCNQRDQKNIQAKLNETTMSMFSSAEVPVLARWLLPTVIIGNVAFFLSGHLSLGGTILINFNLAGQDITINDFYSFSIAQSTIELWNAGGKALAVLIVLFSGIWPYTRLFINFLCWFLPPRLLSVSTRGSMILWLDALAKWSTIDIFVLVITLVAFRITVSSPKMAFLPSDLYSLDLLVVPVWGLYANIIAQHLSQITSHYLIFYHRKIVCKGLEKGDSQVKITGPDASDVESAAIDSGTNIQSSSTTDALKENLKDHGYSRPHRGDKDVIYVRRGVSTATLVTGALLVTLIIVGCCLPCFSLDMLGVLGLAVESGQNFQQAFTEYSVFSIFNLLIDEAAFLGTTKDWIGLVSIALAFVLTVLVVPIFQTLVLLYHWWVPMTRERHLRFVTLTEICQAWQYIEVFVIAVMVSAWQLGSISAFLIESYCDSLTSTLSALAFFGIIAIEDAQCFKVRASIENGTYVLIASAFVLAFLNTLVMTAAAQYSRDCVAREDALAEPTKLDDVSACTMQNESVEEIIDKIQPTPVLFTDEFRWLLRSNGKGDIDDVRTESVGPEMANQQVSYDSEDDSHDLKGNIEQLDSLPDEQSEYDWSTVGIDNH